ncbi:hypothetical protein [Georgenia thermotolerans]|uniref:Uncharacterized protein n=1 Tax=Georgenia thermotolerans TaxID=527326 RepID=A0A7J5UQM8_9MICO|nr:hypothetical protein [Georgenia thermotolerans]KAE8764617.1 hypothetical protein GB883_08090 [Georgenia thermotolerans]
MEGCGAAVPVGEAPGEGRARLGPSTARPRRSRAAGPTAALLAAAGLLGGCATPGGLAGNLSQAASQASSSAASSALGLELYLDGRTTATVADVTLIDMARQVSTAQDAASQQVVAGGDELKLRDDVTGAITAVGDEIDQARALVAGAVPAEEGPALVTDLQARAGALSDTADRLEKAAG